MSGIILHKELGVNPRIVKCPRCDGDTGELVMLGAKNYKDVCTECGMVHYGGADGRRCQKCGNRNLERKTLQDMEPVYSGNLCETCGKAQQAVDEAVKDGGIYWKCEHCGSEGAMVAESDIAKKVRADHPEHDGKPLGILIGDCPVCRPKEEGEEGADGDNGNR